VVDTSDADPANWMKSVVALSGLADMIESSDPEPEFVSINAANKAVVTLQENNHIAIVDLETLRVENSFTAGTVDLEMIDATEDRIIDQVEMLDGIPREPDGVVWLNKNYFATADEGDLE